MQTSKQVYIQENLSENERKEAGGEGSSSSKEAHSKHSNSSKIGSHGSTKEVSIVESNKGAHKRSASGGAPADSAIARDNTNSPISRDPADHTASLRSADLVSPVPRHSFRKADARSVNDPSELTHTLTLLCKSLKNTINSAHKFWRKVVEERFRWQLFKSVLFFTLGLKLFDDLKRHMGQLGQIAKSSAKDSIVVIGRGSAKNGLNGIARGSKSCNKP